MKFTEIKIAQLQKVIDESGKGFQTKRKIKSLLNQIYDYAMQNDIVAKSYSEYIELGKDTEKTPKNPFTMEEIKLL